MQSNEEIVREAYRLVEGDRLDGEAFRALFSEDGAFNDVPNRELLEVRAAGDVVAVELRIQGTHLGAFPTPVGPIPPTGNRIDVPTADLWYLRDGKIRSFNCYNSANVLLARLGAAPDFASAIRAAETPAVSA